ncbi:hypothetical protein [Rhodopseudomonas parapalustris]
MLDVKTWLESTGMKVAELEFIAPPKLPYLVFIDDINTTGADDKNCIVQHNVSIELYSERIDKVSEAKVEELLNEKNFNFDKSRTRIDSEKLCQTLYGFSFTEKF